MLLPQRAHTAALAGSASGSSGPSQVSSGQASLYFIIASHLAASPSSGHALLQIAVCLQHSTLLIDWLGLPGSGSVATPPSCMLLWLFPAATHRLLRGVHAPWQLVLAPICLLRHYWIIWSTSAGLLCIQCLKSQLPWNSQGPYAPLNARACCCCCNLLPTVPRCCS